VPQCLNGTTPLTPIVPHQLSMLTIAAHQHDVHLVHDDNRSDHATVIERPRDLNDVQQHKWSTRRRWLWR